ncbi:MAG: hydroxyisourate hydrolase [Gammaproteobacteria bacterium]|nr:hydroxyisourate hydrolase [Gammaproteobacteria bacterium]
MSQITTHILDTSRGKPAKGVLIELFHYHPDQWTSLGQAKTDEDGRVSDLLLEDHLLAGGMYKLRFDVDGYYQNNNESFYPYVEIAFRVAEGGEHYHIPLLLNPFGYSTYRGS